MQKTSIVLIGIIVLVAIIVLTFIGGYNGMVSKKENVESASSNLDVMLQRRCDLIPNLVSTVKGYTNHETGIIEKVTEARTKLVNANTMEEKSNANNELTSSLNALMVVVENYPDLKSSENFKQLSDELAGTENRIAVARKDYNDAVRTLNDSIKKFQEENIRTINDTRAKERLQRTQKKENDDDDSSDDSLDGWDIRP